MRIRMTGLKYPVLNPDNSSEGMILVKMYVPVRS